jgi:hypothetical protein
MVLPFSQPSWQNKTAPVMYPGSPQHTVTEQKSSYHISNGFLNGGSHTINSSSSFGKNKSESTKAGNLLFV